MNIFGNKELKLELPPTADIKPQLNMESKEESKSWLKHGHPLGLNNNVDLQLLALLSGDGHIKGTPLEGYHSKDSLKFFTDFIANLLEKSPTNEEFQFLNSQKADLENFQKLMLSAQTISEKIHEISEQGEISGIQQVETYAEELTQKLKEEKILWFPGGWQSQNGYGHAFMIRIDVETCTFSIVNSGDGLKYHPNIYLTKKNPLTENVIEEERYQEFMTISRIDKNILESTDLFKFLIELRTVPLWRGVIDLNADQVYLPLIEFLKGSVKPAICPFSYPEIFKKGQRSGTCAIKSVSTSLYYHLCKAFNGSPRDLENSRHCYKKIKYLWQTQALVSFIQQQEKFNDSERLLLREIMENIARSAEKLFHSQLLNESELETLHETLQEISEKISSAKIVDVQESPPENFEIRPYKTAIDQPFAADNENILKEVRPAENSSTKIGQGEKIQQSNFGLMKLDDQVFSCGEKI